MSDEFHKFSPDVEQRLGFMHLYITDGTIFAGFKVAHNAHLANCKRKKNSQYLNLMDLMQRNKTLSLFWFLIGYNLLQNGLGVVRRQHRAEKKG